jgi:hypothetical protein
MGMALIRGSTASARAINAVMSSTGDKVRALKAAIASTADK